MPVESPPPAPEVYERYRRGELATAPDWAWIDAAEVSGAPDRVAEQISDAIRTHMRGLVDVSRDIHAHPELNFEEHHAAAAVATLLRSLGFEIEVGRWGLETAFRSTVGTGTPHVAILAEYDALPEVGHGCGHNVICATAVGAFLCVAPLVAELGGKVSLFGTPAEEGGGGKELIARAGGLDDVDAALMAHPGDEDYAHIRCLGLRQVDVTFRGRSAHAASAAYLGRNALDAAVSAYTSLAQLRQHLLPEDRVHGVITKGGAKANIVPEQAALSYYLRSPTVETLEELTNRTEAIFRAAAAATATSVEIDWDVAPIFLPVRTNAALASRYIEAMQARGRDVRREGTRPSGSTDLGNLSVRIPSIHPIVAMVEPGIPAHSHDFREASVSPDAEAAIEDAAVALAQTAADYLADPILRRTVAEEFEAAGGAVNVVALDR